jgi:hypothetical protein
LQHILESHIIHAMKRGEFLKHISRNGEKSHGPWIVSGIVEQHLLLGIIPRERARILHTDHERIARRVTDRNETPHPIYVNVYDSKTIATNTINSDGAFLSTKFYPRDSINQAGLVTMPDGRHIRFKRFLRRHS